jgi:hypothetical protein
VVCDDRVRAGEAELSTQQIAENQDRQEESIPVKSYLYMRLAIVALLVALGVSVAYQTAGQGWHPLASVSAYYYTAAQAIFVGALLGFAAIMIALKGTTAIEDVFLNLGGMFAAVVAVVPTSRGADFDAAVAACHQEQDGPLLTDRSSGAADCPKTDALVEAARANIDNNMRTLVVVGVLAFVITLFVAWKTRQPFSWKAFGGGAVVLLTGSLAFWIAPEWFSHNAHWIAAVGLFGCIFVVALANALRKEGKTLVIAAGEERTVGQKVGEAARILVQKPDHRNLYNWIALLMLAVGVVAVFAWAQDWITLFWLEIIVFLLFIAFWVTQTLEQGNKMPGAERGTT